MLALLLRAFADDALLDVGLQDAESLLVSLHREVQCMQHTLRGEVVRDDPLRNLHRLGRHPKRLRVQPKTDDQLFGRAGQAAKVGLRASGASVVDTVNWRAQSLDTIDQLRSTSLDFYAAVRNGYLQRREAQIADRRDTAEEAEEDLYYFDEDEEPGP